MSELITRECPNCHKKFTTTYSTKVYCSYRCKEEYKSTLQKIRVSTPVPESRKCEYCGKEFKPKVHNQKYCSDECSRAVQFGIKTSQERNTKVKCPQCGKEFVPNSNQKFCSTRCRDRHSHGRPRPAKKSTGKTLSDWAREANECNLDYGNYRAMIESGKTFDELKATAYTRATTCHSRVRASRLV